MRILLSRIRALLDRTRLERDLHDEVQAHLDLHAADFERRGMTPTAARLAARRAFGGVEPMKETYRDGRGLRWVEDLWRDVRYAVRMLARDRGLTVTAVLTLMAGIGANTALFTVIDALMWKRLPVQRPDDLRLFTIVRPARTPAFTFSYPFFEDVRATADAFSGLIAFSGVNQTRLRVSGDRQTQTAEQSAGAQAEVTRSQGVTGNFFSVLGVSAASGRLLDVADDRPEMPVAAAVISDGFWARRFGRDPHVVGRRITLNEAPFEIVGVAAAGFRGVEVGTDPDLWWPLQAFPRVVRTSATIFRQRAIESWRIIGRLRPGVDEARAQAQVAVPFAADLAERFQAQVARFGSAMTEAERRSFTDETVQLESAAAGWTGLRWQFRRPLVVLMAVVGVVLLIACANVANLLLARGATRRREIAVRMALGSGRTRLIRQLLTESLLLAGAGGVLGVLVAVEGSRMVAAFMEDQDVVLGVGPDARILGFTAVISFGSALLFGLMPSLTATRGNLTSSLNEQSRGTTGGRLTIHNAIVVFQIALSVVVLVAAGLFGRTLTNLERLDTGYEAAHLTVFGIDVPSGYDPARRAALYRDVIDRFEASPGAQAAISYFGVLSGNGLSDPVGIPGYTPRPGESLRAYGTIVSGGFFEAAGTRIVLGRDFERADEGSPVRVAVINQVMARRLFGERPLGRRFTLPGLFPNESFEVVGVAADSTYRNLRAEAEEVVPAFYLPFTQPPGASIGARMRYIQVELRTPMAQSGVEALIRRTLRAVDPAVALTELHPMTAVIDRAIARERLLARFALGFGGLALALGAIGIYGVRSYAVTRRTSEMGLRIALGATTSQVFGLVVGQGAKVAAVGIAIGLAVAAGVMRLLEGLLFRVAPLDPITFVAVAVVFASVAVAASYVPARRAAKVDPAVALRSE